MVTDAWTALKPKSGKVKGPYRKEQCRSARVLGQGSVDVSSGSFTEI